MSPSNGSLTGAGFAPGACSTRRRSLTPRRHPPHVERILAAAMPVITAALSGTTTGADARSGFARSTRSTLKCGAFLCVSRYSVLPISAASVTSSSRPATRRHGGTPCASDATGAAYSANSRWLPLPTTPIAYGRAGRREHDRRGERVRATMSARDARAEDRAIASRGRCRSRGRRRGSSDTCRTSARRARASAGGCRAGDCRRSRTGGPNCARSIASPVSLPVATSITCSTLSSEPPGEMPYAT